MGAEVSCLYDAAFANKLPVAYPTASCVGEATARSGQGREGVEIPSSIRSPRRRDVSDRQTKRDRGWSGMPIEHSRRLTLRR